MRYIAELEQKVQILQTEATTLSAQLTLLQVPSYSSLSGPRFPMHLELQRNPQRVRANR